MNIFFVRNQAQQVLFAMELQGQISDGHWEDAGPKDHWIEWYDASTVVRPSGVGRNFHPRYDTYAFASRQLLDVVAGRMMSYVRIAKVFGLDFAKSVGVLVRLDGGTRTEAPDHLGDFWSYVRSLCRVLDLKELDRVARDETIYDREQLVADLLDLSKIAQIYTAE